MESRKGHSSLRSEHEANTETPMFKGVFIFICSREKQSLISSILIPVSLTGFVYGW